jgi:hypothetical protein
MANTNELIRTFNSISGVDIKAVFAGRPVGTLQGISYSVARDKAPIFTMGSADARSFGRGKRHIAGSMVFIQFDMDPVMEVLANPDKSQNQLKFLSDIDDLRPEYQAGGLTDGLTAGEGSANFPGAPVQQQESAITVVGDDQQEAIPWYTDQIPPFDVVLSGANEYGVLAQMKIHGVEFLNSGYGVSIDDIVSEHSHTFIATSISPWRSYGIHSSMVEQ